MPPIVDGTPVDQATTNPAFIYKNANDTSAGVLTLNAPTSGAQINDIQNTINVLINGVGGTQSLAPTAWSGVPANTIASGDQISVGVTKLAKKFFGTAASGGHSHSGVDGDGAPISATAVGNPTLKALWVSIGAVNPTGASAIDISAITVSYIASSSITVEGVVVNNPYNLAIVNYDAGNGAQTPYQIIDTIGNPVYGRITAPSGSSGTWYLTTYVNVAGVETGYAVPAASGTAITVNARVIVNPLNNIYAYQNPYFLQKNLHSVAPSGGTKIFGDLLLAPSGGTLIAQTGQGITIYSPPASTSDSLDVFGTFASPQLVTASAGISFSSTKKMVVVFVKGNGGNVAVTANPQITAPSFEGQGLQIVGCAASATVGITDGNGFALNGNQVLSQYNIGNYRGGGGLWIDAGRSF